MIEPETHNVYINLERFIGRLDEVEKVESNEKTAKALEYMKSALALLDERMQEFQPPQGLGLSEDNK